MKSKLGMKVAALGAAVLMTVALSPAASADAQGRKFIGIDKAPGVVVSNFARSYVATTPKPQHIAKSAVGAGKTLTFSITVPKGCVAIKFKDIETKRVKKASVKWTVDGVNKTAAFAKVGPYKQVWVKPGQTITFTATKAKPARYTGTATLTNTVLKCKVA
ncbi:hypothetical protein [Demequina maris]|uniref:hypothetical protein n=1 Tax=Demequina maris TaxID=1638982 RepID=UPI000B2FAB16|nr:hypothetical protein [Demequina maris]